MPSIAHIIRVCYKKTRPDQVHGVRRCYTAGNIRGCRYLWMHITGSAPLKYIQWAGLNIGTVISFPEPKEVNLLFRQMFSLFKNQDALFYMETMGAVIRILAAMGRGASGTPAPEKAVAYLHRHFAQAVTVEQLAMLESKSVSQLRRDFVRKLGKSPKQYLTEIRMRAACHMLCTTRDQVEQIAAECGYEDSHYFCRLFRKEMGCTPSQYREAPTTRQEKE